jgi:SAM-dependent methyltransferase
LLLILKCVKCGAEPVQRTPAGWSCSNCAAAYPIVDNVARFVSSEQYVGSFGFQWNRFSKSQLDSANGTTRSLDTFEEKTGWEVESLRGLEVLDAGCGMGRFAQVCAAAGARVHAIDLSRAVDAAARNLSDRSNLYFYQADLMNLPFVDGSFDAIYSLGVLHHTPDTRRAFLSLVRLLKPGGRIAIWVYSAKLRLMIGGELLRLVTPRLSTERLLSLCRIAVPLYHLHRVPVIGRATTALLPTSLNPDPEWRWLDTFDWYAPRYQWKHTFAEVERWFHEAGLTGIVRASFPVSVRGQRKTSG